MEEEEEDDIALESKKRNFYVFADAYHKIIQLEARNSNSQLDPEKSLINSIRWYNEHIQEIGLTNLKVVLLTMNKKYAELNRTSWEVYNLIDFLKNKNSNLLDFIGFAEMETEMAQ